MNHNPLVFFDGQLFSLKQKAPIIERVNEILAAMQCRDAKSCVSTTDIDALEKEIDQLVYKLYGLSPEEIAIVEGKG